MVKLSASARTSWRFTLNTAGAMLGWEMSPEQLGDGRPAVADAGRRPLPGRPLDAAGRRHHAGHRLRPARRRGGARGALESGQRARRGRGGGMSGPAAGTVRRALLVTGPGREADALFEALCGEASGDGGWAWQAIDGPGDRLIVPIASGCRPTPSPARTPWSTTPARRARDPRAAVDLADARRVLEAALAAGVPRIVVLSSTEAHPPSHRHLGLLSEDRFRPAGGDPPVEPPLDRPRRAGGGAGDRPAGGRGRPARTRARRHRAPRGAARRPRRARLLQPAALRPGRRHRARVRSVDPAPGAGRTWPGRSSGARSADGRALSCPGSRAGATIYNVVPSGTAPVHRAVRLAGGHRLPVPLWLQRLAAIVSRPVRPGPRAGAGRLPALPVDRGRRAGGARARLHGAPVDRRGGGGHRPWRRDRVAEPRPGELRDGLRETGPGSGGATGSTPSAWTGLRGALRPDPLPLPPRRLLAGRGPRPRARAAEGAACSPASIGASCPTTARWPSTSWRARPGATRASCSTRRSPSSPSSPTS